MNDNKVIVEVPGSSRNQHSFSEQHITTASFMRPNVVFASEVIPNRTIKHIMECFTRLAPLPVPTFGRAKFYCRSFFVPFRTIFPAWTEFIVGSPTVSGGNTSMVENVPLISNKQLINFFVQTPYSTSYTDAGDGYDFQVSTYSSGTQATVLNPRSFTDKGAYLYKVLLSLGYNINWNADDESTYSLLPLMSFAKVLLDWYSPSSYAYSSIYNYWTNVFTMQGVFQLTNSAAVNSLMTNLYDLCYCEYDRSYFTSAFDNPIGPNRSAYSPVMSFRDITAESHTGLVTNDGDVNSSRTPMAKLTDDRFTQYMDDALKSLTDYTRRHAISGVRALDRYLSEYGINLSSEVLKRSLYLDSSDFDIQFGDVMSHADTDSSPLGSYAGKGIGYGKFDFGFSNSNEFGYYLVISSIIPIVGYYEGQDRLTMHKYIQDFWHADFDCLGTQPISMRELFVDRNGNSVYSVAGFADQTTAISLNDAIFAYAPRYAEYKVGHDKITGNYRLASRNKGLPSYYLMRNVPVNTRDLPINSKHSYNFVVGSDAEQYNRIFYAEKGENFNIIYSSQVTYEDNAAPLYDTYEFEKGFKTLQMNIGGTTIN